MKRNDETMKRSRTIRTVRVLDSGVRVIDLDYDPECGAERARIVIVPKAILPAICLNAMQFYDRLPFCEHLFARAHVEGPGRFYAFAPVITHDNSRFYVLSQQCGYDV